MLGAKSPSSGVVATVAPVAVAVANTVTVEISLATEAVYSVVSAAKGPAPASPRRPPSGSAALSVVSAVVVPEQVPLPLVRQTVTVPLLPGFEPEKKLLKVK